MDMQSVNISCDSALEQSIVMWNGHNNKQIGS